MRNPDGQKHIEEGGMMQSRCFMKKEDESLIDVENVETTSSTTVLSSPRWPPFLLQFCLLRLSVASHASLLHLPLGSLHCFNLLALSVSTSLRLLRALCCSCLEVFARFCAVTCVFDSLTMRPLNHRKSQPKRGRQRF